MSLPVELWDERMLTSAVADLARLGGWLRYHTFWSKHSPRGFPDEVLVRPPRVIFAELKTETGKLSEAQEGWLVALSKCPGVEVYLWRPSDLETIAKTLTGARVRAA